MNPVRMLVVTALAVSGLFAGVAPAWAHAVLESSSPAQGETLASAPSEVKLTFGEAVTLPPDPISVSGPDGAKWTVGPATLAGPVITAPVTPSGPAGAYTLDYKVISDDGDAVTGTVSFTLSVPAPAAAPAAAPSQAPSGPGGLPSSLWVVLTLIVVLGGAVAVAARTRHRS